MIDHMSLSVSDFDKSLAFFTAALAPLGYGVMMRFPGEKGGQLAGLGATAPDFWLVGPGTPSDPHVHLAFTADDRAKVDAFYKAALAAGGTDNGAPGLRTQYHPDYYGAFVFDPDGNNIEAVCHKPG